MLVTELTFLDQRYNFLPTNWVTDGMCQGPSCCPLNAEKAAPNPTSNCIATVKGVKVGLGFYSLQLKREQRKYV